MSGLNDPRRLFGNLIQIGTIESVDLGEATCRVKIGDIVTGDICWIVSRAGDTRIWNPPSVGEQCLLLCPEADPEAGIAVLGMFSDAHPAPSNEAIFLAQFKDDARLSYDPEGHELKVELGEGGKITFIAPGGITLDADLHVTGDVTVDKKVTATDDVVGGGKSLKGHKHSGVQAGSAQSGAPV